MRLLAMICSSLILVAPLALAEISSGERQALIDLYQATDGDHWINNQGWLGEPGTECDWHGVFCLGAASGDPYVRSLHLSANGLNGPLPGTLVGLERVRGLHLARNEINGLIPLSLAELAELITLDLGANRLSGPIPGELLGASIRYIYLQDNQLDGYTEATVSSGHGSTSIRLSGNPITTLPPESWRDSGVLVRLDLDRTGMGGELDFGHHPWPGLRYLQLDGNGITSVTGINSETLIDLLQLLLAGNHLVGQWPVNRQTLPNLQILDLTGNGLKAPPPANLSDHPRLRELRLGRNELVGTDLLPLFVAPALRLLELNHNPLGALPQNLWGGVGALQSLNLSTSGLEGDPPAWFGDLALRNLNLSGNRLSGDLEPWLAAVSGGQRVQLDLSRNQFEGPLPESLMLIDFAQRTETSTGLNLCWNRFDQPIDSEFEGFLSEVHFAGSLANCNNRQTADIDLTVSGSWYNPDRVGKGYTLMMLDNGLLLHYWFGYPLIADKSIDEQKWSLQIVAPDATVAVYPPSLVPYGGRFGYGLGEGELTTHGNRELEMVRLAGDTLNVHSGWRQQGRYIRFSPPPPPIQERFDHIRLTELAGTTCENQSPFQQYAGAWFHPEANGEGFLLEVLPDDRGLVYWFTYAPDDSGRQAWMIGEGHFEQAGGIIGTPPPGHLLARVDIDQLIQPVGSVLGPNFDSEAVEHIEWGSLRLDFHSDGTGHAYWDSVLADYGSGDYSLERLARPMLAECEPEVRP
jgi:hypothetical protein